MSKSNSEAVQRVLVIFNPVAGRRRRQRVGRFIAACAAGGAKVDLHQTVGPGDAESVASRARGGTYDAVVAAGGDGTINETINGMMVEREGPIPPLGVLALGTANVLAHELSLPREPEEAAAVVLAGNRRRLSLGLANGRHFALMAGVGFDAAVVAGVDPLWKRRLHQGAYVLSSLQTMRRFRYPLYRVTVGAETYEARSLIACKARHYGGPFVVAPAADTSVPSFQLLLFERGGIVSTGRYGIAMLRGRLYRSRGVRLLETAEVLIEGPEGDPVHGDGELFGQLPLSLAIARRPLEVLVPALSARS